MPQPRRKTAGNRQEADAVRALAGDQGGIVARSQLLAAGVSASAIQRAFRSGRLHRVHPGVYSTLAPELINEDGLVIAALQAAGPGRS
jgi:hypothetical protein